MNKKKPELVPVLAEPTDFGVQRNLLISCGDERARSQLTQGLVLTLLLSGKSTLVLTPGGRYWPLYTNLGGFYARMGTDEEYKDLEVTGGRDTGLGVLDFAAVVDPCPAHALETLFATGPQLLVLDEYEQLESKCEGLEESVAHYIESGGLVFISACDEKSIGHYASLPGMHRLTLTEARA